MCDLNNITYSRNTGTEDKVFYEMNKTQSFIRAALSDVSLPPRVPKAEYYQTVYKPFLLKTTEEMNRLTTSYKFNLSAEGQPMFTGVSPTGFAQKAYVINIICYGKSLMYILKYIAFWFLKINPEYLSSISILCFCDSESYHNYATEQLIVPPNKSTQHMGEQSFHDFLGKTRDDYFLGEDEARIIRLLDIRFVQSSHFLMKGIGGKRALIQYYNYVHLSNNDPNFMCMTIDDNITSVYHILPGCKFRRINKEECATLSLIDIYNILRTVMTQHTNVFIAGINKGSATSETEIGYKDGQCRTVYNTGAIYKLNLTRVVSLMEEKFFYNPYFTRFFEDVVFNDELAFYSHTYKHNCIHLLFGHFNIDSTDKCAMQIKDHDVNFPDYLKSHFKSVPGIQPIFIMYAIFCKAAYDGGFLKIEMSKKEIDKRIWLPQFYFFGREGLGFPTNKKYSVYQYVFYMYALLIGWKSDNQLLNDICSVASQSGTPSYMRRTFVTWVNNKIIDIWLHRSRNENKLTIQYSLTQQFPAAQLLKIDNKMMPMIYQGVCEPCAAEYSQYWQYISQFCTFVDKVNNKEATTIIVDGVDILKPLSKKRALDNSAADGADGRGAQRTKTKKGGKRRRRSKAKTSKQR